jgi:hypothetical protein
MNQFFEGDLSTFPEIDLITGDSFLALGKNLTAKKTDSLKGFPCIMAHRSAFDREQIEVLREYCKENRKPLVFFSGGITASIYNDSAFPFLHINSRDFYSTNFELFLEDLRNTGVINLLVLQFGLHWRMTLLLRMRNDINYLIQINAIKLIQDLKINKLIKDELVEKFELDWLNKADFNPVSETEVSEFYKKLNVLIVESV